ncbi:polyprenyl synthetase family protein [Microbacterium caowuchunii]|uniref:polyprenyl synthetase family protein n=1 Tax=Microbacterium caowuchunii TaxID=2614638 RepID=UPI001EE7C1DB|nr:polyprenyl synthetase family protein [Microbacterium caowuchunii]
MSSMSDAIEAVSQRLDNFFSSQYRKAGETGPEGADFVRATAASVHGGKRLRARFCLTGWRAVAEVAGRGSTPDDAAVAAAASLEVFHAAALVHDDLIDNSDTRRGHPAAHRALEAHHRGRGWAGDAAAFGRSAAILGGDLLVAWSDDLLEEGLLRARPEDAAVARAEYGRMRRGVTIGQFLDIAEESAFVTEDDERHAERALRVASLKSARYSVEQPLRIGAALAGASDAQLDALGAFGHPIGMAFQLRDDVLGVFGDAEVTGKPSGDDLREGKRTVLIAYTREGLAPADRPRFDALIGDPTLHADQIAALQRTIVETGALERVEELISSYTAEADRALATAHLGEAAVAELEELARAATARAA